MIKENPFLKKRVEEKAEIFVRVPIHWQGGNMWSASPREIIAKFNDAGGGSEINLMSCYVSKHTDILQVTTLRPAGVFVAKKDEDKTVLDAYMPMILKALITHAHIIGAKKLLVQSLEMPFIYDHLLDAGFQLCDHAIQNGGVYEFQE